MIYRSLFEVESSLSPLSNQDRAASLRNALLKRISRMGMNLAVLAVSDIIDDNKFPSIACRVYLWGSRAKKRVVRSFYFNFQLLENNWQIITITFGNFEFPLQSSGRRVHQRGVRMFNRRKIIIQKTLSGTWRKKKRVRCWTESEEENNIVGHNIFPSSCFCIVKRVI